MKYLTDMETVYLHNSIAMCNMHISVAENFLHGNWTTYDATMVKSHLNRIKRILSK